MFSTTFDCKDVNYYERCASEVALYSSTMWYTMLYLNAYKMEALQRTEKKGIGFHCQYEIRLVFVCANINFNTNKKIN